MRIEPPAADHVPALRQLWQEAFGDEDAFLDAFFSTVFSPERCLCVMDGDEPVAVAYWFDTACSGTAAAYLYAVATKKCCRGRGLCRMLLEALHRRLADLGYAGALLVPGNAELARMYEHLGYRYSASVQEIACTAGDTRVILQSICAAEYLQRRSALLPAGSAVLDGKYAEFLQTQAEFYQGKDFLLAAELTGSSVRGIELLGNPAAAPGILRALDGETGVFRMPGTGRNFAMYYPLDQRITPPVYFNLAFD